MATQFLLAEQSACHREQRLIGSKNRPRHHLRRQLRSPEPGLSRFCPFQFVLEITLSPATRANGGFLARLGRNHKNAAPHRTNDRQITIAPIQNRDAATCMEEIRATPPDCLTVEQRVVGDAGRGVGLLFKILLVFQTKYTRSK